MSDEPLEISLRTRFRAALLLAILADALQIVVFPLFAEGGYSPADDLLDFAIAAALSLLIGWHWEFLPSLVGELIPGLDMVPFWTLAVFNVYRRTRSDLRQQERERPALNPPEILPPSTGANR